MWQTTENWFQCFPFNQENGLWRLILCFHSGWCSLFIGNSSLIVLFPWQLTSESGNPCSCSIHVNLDRFIPYRSTDDCRRSSSKDWTANMDQWWVWWCYCGNGQAYGFCNLFVYPQSFNFTLETAGSLSFGFFIVNDIFLLILFIGRIHTGTSANQAQSFFHFKNCMYIYVLYALQLYAKRETKQALKLSSRWLHHWPSYLSLLI